MTLVGSPDRDRTDEPSLRQRDALPSELQDYFIYTFIHFLIELSETLYILPVPTYPNSDI